MNVSLKMLVIALCLTLTACGGDDDAGSPATDAATGGQGLDDATADGGADTANASTSSPWTRPRAPTTAN